MSLGTIGSYEVITTLGSGPRGSVYRARHATFGRIAAIKHLTASVSPDSAEFLRLQQEVERLKSVPARHVAATMAVELADGRPLIEMESLGEGLDRALRLRPLDAREALRAVMDVLSGLRDLHAAGIVHANLKPANVLQDTTNRSWKITDGGLTGIESHSSPTLLVTSVLYVAPEMIAEVPRSDERSDLYSVGMVGLEAMLGGGLLDAFPRLSRSATPSRWLSWLEDAGTEAVPLHVLRPEVPVEVSAFFARLLAKDPERRFQSAGEALDALEEVLPVVAAGQPVPPPRAVDTPTLRPTPIPPSSVTPTPAPGWTPAPTLMIGTPAQASTPGPMPVPKAMASGARIVVTGPNGFEGRFALSDRTLRIGRDAKNDITLPDDTKAISRMHAEIRREQGQYIMVDLDSQNGLWVGGKRKNNIQLASGVAIKIGEYTLTPGGDAITRPPAVPKAAATTTPANQGSAKLAQVAAMARTWWPPKTVQQRAILGSIAAVLVAGVTWAAWPEPALVAVPPTEVTPIAPPTVTVTPTETPDPKAQARDKALADGQGFLDSKEWQLAIDAVKPVLDEDPANAEAQRITTAAQDGLKAQQLASANTSQRGKAKPDGGKPSPGQDQPPPNPGDEKRQRLDKKFDEATRTSDSKAAVDKFREIHTEDPLYPGVADAIAKRCGQVVAEALNSAKQQEDSGHHPRARTTYQSARDSCPDTPGLKGPMDGLAARMKKLGDEALTRAKAHEAVILDLPQRKAVAIQEYQTAVDYLPEGDTNRALARQALLRLTGRI